MSKTELRNTLMHVARVAPQFQSEVGSLEIGWFLAADLADETHPALQQALEQQKTAYPGADTRTQGSLFINEYGWYVPAVAIASLLIAKRVPDLTHTNVALRYRTLTWEEDGESGEYEHLDVRFLSGRFAALPDDSAADQDDVIVMPDTTTLREWLRQQVETHMQPLVERTHRLSRLSKDALWRIVADSCAAAFLQAGKLKDDPALGEREGRAFVKVPTSPLNNPQLHYLTLTHAGYSETFRVRGGCCRYYTLPAGEYCNTCVLLKSDDRVARLMKYVKKHTEESNL